LIRITSRVDMAISVCPYERRGFGDNIRTNRYLFNIILELMDSDSVTTAYLLAFIFLFILLQIMSKLTWVVILNTHRTGNAFIYLIYIYQPI